MTTRIVSAREFADVFEPGADPLVGEPGQVVIPEGGDVMIYGDGGASKTTLSIDLGGHLAAGDDWLGIPIPEPVRVLVLEAEGPRPLFRAKLRGKLDGWAGSDLGDRLLVVEAPWAAFRFPEGGEIADLIAEREIDVLIVGPLTRVGMDELGTLQQVRDFMGHVARFRKRTGRRLTVILVHHENKGGSVSGAWEGAGDTLLHAQVHRPGRTTLGFQKARWAPGWHKRSVELDWTDGEGFEVADAEEERDFTEEIAALLTGGKVRTLEEIRRPKEKGGIGAAKETVREALENGGDRFESFTGADAAALGRHPNSTVWRLALGQKLDELDAPSAGSGSARLASSSPVRELEAFGLDPEADDGLAQTPELDRATPADEAEVERIAAKFGEPA